MTDTEEQTLTINEATIILVAKVLQIERGAAELQMADAISLISQAIKELR